MKPNAKKQKDVYGSPLEFRRAFFPKAEAEKAQAQRTAENEGQGTGLAEETIRRIRQRLSTELRACRS